MTEHKFTDCGGSALLSLRVDHHHNQAVIRLSDSGVGFDAQLLSRCDIGLPGMDGYEVARQLRTHAQLRSAVLIALTRYAAQHDRQQAVDAGFDCTWRSP